MEITGRIIWPLRPEPFLIPKAAEEKSIKTLEIDLTIRNSNKNNFTHFCGGYPFALQKDYAAISQSSGKKVVLAYIAGEFWVNTD